MNDDFLNFENFLKKISNVVDIYKSKELEYKNIFSVTLNILKNKSNKKIPDLYTGVFWSVGGFSGGSCWGNEATRFISNEPVGDINIILCKILKAVGKEKISFVDYYLYITPLFEDSSFIEREYYGNQTNYACKCVNLQNLFNVLKEINFN